LEQFILRIDILNSFILFLVSLFLVVFLILFSAQVLFVFLCDFAYSIIKDIAQDDITFFSKNSLGLVTIFISLVVCNVVGLLPFSFTLTSSLAAPFFFSFAVFFVYFYILVSKYGLKMFAGFLPAGTNVYIAPILILIEVLSTAAKFISLGIRLFANMFAGHLLLKVFYSISFKILIGSTLFLLINNTVVTFFLIAIIALEFMIAFLQSFVLLLLSSLYFKEAEHFIGGGH
jgi:F-type H+-transporting ATPase subunit a